MITEQEEIARNAARPKSDTATIHIDVPAKRVVTSLAPRFSTNGRRATIVFFTHHDCDDNAMLSGDIAEPVDNYVQHAIIAHTTCGAVLPHDGERFAYYYNEYFGEVVDEALTATKQTPSDWVRDTKSLGDSRTVYFVFPDGNACEYTEQMVPLVKARKPRQQPDAPTPVKSIRKTRKQALDAAIANLIAKSTTLQGAELIIHVESIATLVKLCKDLEPNQ